MKLKLIWRPGIGLDISQRLCKLDQLLAVLANLAGEVLSDVPAGNTNHSYNMVGCNSLAYVQDWRWYMYVDIQPMLLIPSPLCNGRQHTCLCSSEGCSPRDDNDGDDDDEDDNVHACVLLKEVVLPQHLLLVLPQLEAHLGVVWKNKQKIWYILFICTTLKIWKK